MTEDDVGLDITRPISIKKHPNGVQNSPITMGIVSIPPMTKTPPTTNILVFAIVNTHPMYAFIIFRYMTRINLDTMCIYQCLANIMFCKISIERYIESARI